MIRWPWVSAEVADQIERRRVSERELDERRIADLKATIAKQDADYAQLFAEFVTLVKPPVVITNGKHEPAPKPRSVVAEAIRAESRGDPALAGYFVKRAAELKKEGKSPEEIADAIGGWESSENAGDAGNTSLLVRTESD